MEQQTVKILHLASLLRSLLRNISPPIKQAVYICDRKRSMTVKSLSDRFFLLLEVVQSKTKTSSMMASIKSHHFSPDRDNHFTRGGSPKSRGQQLLQSTVDISNRRHLELYNISTHTIIKKF